MILDTLQILDCSIDPETPDRWSAFFAGFFAVALVFARHRLAIRRRLPRFALLAAAIMLAGRALYLTAYPMASARENLRETLHRRWSLLLDPNVLSVELAHEHRNPDIQLPFLPQGTVLTAYDSSSLSIELARTGRISINGACMSAEMLKIIIVKRKQRISHPFRCILFADAHAEDQAKNKLIALLREIGCSNIYFAGLSQPDNAAQPAPVVIPVP